MVKICETCWDAKSLAWKSETETNHAKLQDWNRCTINKTSRLFPKTGEISRSDEKFMRLKILEVPFATPVSRDKWKMGCKEKWEKVTLLLLLLLVCYSKAHLSEILWFVIFNLLLNCLDCCKRWQTCQDVTFKLKRIALFCKLCFR